jgi:hypothetical protein
MFCLIWNLHVHCNVQKSPQFDSYPEPEDSHFFSLNLCGGTLGTVATTGLLYQAHMVGDGDCGEIGGMKIGRGNRSTWRKSAPAPLCPP